MPDQIVKPIHALKVIVNLLSREAVRVKRGERVEITQWGGHVPRKARVERIEPFGRSTISALGIEEQHVNLVILFDAVSATILNPVKCAYRRFTGPGPVTGPLGKMSLAFGTQDWKTS